MARAFPVRQTKSATGHVTSCVQYFFKTTKLKSEIRLLRMSLFTCPQSSEPACLFLFFLVYDLSFLNCLLSHSYYIS